MLDPANHFIRIYRGQGADYHALIAAEDADNHLLPALQAITPLAVKRILDLGSGTGRIPLLLQGLDCQVVAMDLHREMLREQARQRQHAHGEWRLVQADLRIVPLALGWADIVIAGWAIGHFNSWFGQDWRAQVDRALAAMRGAAKPGGVLIILETMGTGVEQPAPPAPGLADYYAYLENQHGFSRQVISTDYHFASVEQAVELCGFFFGAELAARVQARGWQRVPEFTGVWSKH